MLCAEQSLRNPPFFYLPTGSVVISPRSVAVGSWLIATCAAAAAAAPPPARCGGKTGARSVERVQGYEGPSVDAWRAWRQHAQLRCSGTSITAPAAAAGSALLRQPPNSSSGGGSGHTFGGLYVLPSRPPVGNGRGLRAVRYTSSQLPQSGAAICGHGRGRGADRGVSVVRRAATAERKAGAPLPSQARPEHPSTCSAAAWLPLPNTWHSSKRGVQRRGAHLSRAEGFALCGANAHVGQRDGDSKGAARLGGGGRDADVATHSGALQGGQPLAVGNHLRGRQRVCVGGWDGSRAACAGQHGHSSQSSVQACQSTGAARRCRGTHLQHPVVADARERGSDLVWSACQGDATDESALAVESTGTCGT